MKTGIYHNQTIRVEEADVPEVLDNGVILQNICCGLTEADAAVIRAGSLPEGCRPGHSLVSRIAECGMNVYDFNIGERVYPNGLLACGNEGIPEAIGGFSEYTSIPDAVFNETLFPIPDSISDRTATLIAPFAIGCHAARKGMKLRSAESVCRVLDDQSSYSGEIRYAEGENALVFGAGITGIAAALFLKWFGMDKVMICDSSASRLAVAAKLGFSVCNYAETDFYKALCGMFDCWGLRSLGIPAIDCWIDMTGMAFAAEQFARYGKPGSRMVMAGSASSLPCPLEELMRTERTLIGCCGSEPEDILDVIGLMSANYYDLEALLAGDFPLDRLDDAITAAMDCAAAVVVSMESA